MADQHARPGKTFMDMMELILKHQRRPNDPFSPQLLMAIFWEETFFTNRKQDVGTAIGFGQTEPAELPKLTTQLARDKGYELPGVSAATRELDDPRAVTAPSCLLLHLFHAAPPTASTTEARVRFALEGYGGVHFKGKSSLTKEQRLAIIANWRKCEEKLKALPFSVYSVVNFTGNLDQLAERYMDALHLARPFLRDFKFTTPPQMRVRDILFPPGWSLPGFGPSINTTSTANPNATAAAPASRPAESLLEELASRRGGRSRQWGADGFGSASERRQADAFFFDLAGGRRRAPRPHYRAAFTSVPAEDDPPPRKFKAQDLAPHMAGTEYTLAADGEVQMGGRAVAQKAGTTVTVVTWDNDKPDVAVTIGGVSAQVSKELLKVTSTQYSAKVTTAKTAAAKTAYEIACPLYASNLRALRATIAKAKAKGETPNAGTVTEFNRHLIIESMLNRFDPLIGAWTGYYHATIGEKRDWKFLAPSWVKAVMIQESTAGVFGKYLATVKKVPLFNRFNLMQAIDSWGFQQFIMMEEIEPGLLKKEGMDKILDHQKALATEWDSLKAKKTRTTAEEDRLTYLNELKFANLAELKSPTWTTFFERYPDVDLKPKKAAPRPAPSGTGTGGSTTTTTTGTGGGGTGGGGRRTYWDVVVDFLAGGTPKKRQDDYSFWIRTGVRWLYEKRLGTSTWSDAVRDYNGTGAGAEFYRAIVLARARASSAAAGIVDEIWGDFACANPKDAKTADGVFQFHTFEHAANPCDPRI